MKITITLDTGEKINIKGDNLQIDTGVRLEEFTHYDTASEEPRVKKKKVKSKKKVEIVAKKKLKQPRTTEADKEYMRELKEEGKSSAEVSQITGFSLATVNRHWIPVTPSPVFDGEEAFEDEN